MDVVTINKGDPIDKRLCAYIHKGDVIIIRRYDDRFHCTAIPGKYGENVLHIKGSTTDDTIIIQDQLLVFKSEKGVKLEITKTL